MSVRKRDIEFSDDAQRDYRDILVYGEEEWGVVQRDRYEARLNRGVQALARHPFLGRPAAISDRVCEASSSSIMVQHHVILYRVEETTIRVLRLMHNRMDIDALSIDE